MFVSFLVVEKEERKCHFYSLFLPDHFVSFQTSTNQINDILSNVIQANSAQLK